MMFLTVLAGGFFDGVPYVPLALALVWTLRYQKVADLSLAGSFAVGGALFVVAVRAGLPIAVAIPLGLLVGAAIGSTTGAIINWLNIEGLLSGLLVLFGAYGISLSITQGTLVLPPDRNPMVFLQSLELSGGVGSYYPLQSTGLGVCSAAMIGLSLLLLRSEWGCAYRALEEPRGGRNLLRNLGLRPEIFSIEGFATSGMLAALSGILVALQAGQTTSSMGLESFLEIVPAYLLGTVIFDHESWIYRAVRVGRNDCRVMGRRIYLSSEVAAAVGVVIYFTIVNYSHFLTPLEWLPRVLVAGVVVALLGGGAGLEMRKELKDQRKSTNFIEAGRALRISDLWVEVSSNGESKRLFSGFEFLAHPGKVTQIVGPNGAGKTTLLRVLVGLVRSKGSFDVPVASCDRPYTRYSAIGYVPQDATEISAGTLSVAEHWFLAKRAPKLSLVRPWRRGRDGMGDRYFKVGNFSGKQVVGSLSGGQRRRVLLEMLKLRRCPPAVVALDEPFSDLDRDGVHECTEIIESFRSGGRTVLLVDHEGRIQVDEEIEVLGAGRGVG